jgi:hypothetical protein
MGVPIGRRAVDKLPESPYIAQMPAGGIPLYRRLEADKAY